VAALAAVAVAGLATVTACGSSGGAAPPGAEKLTGKARCDANKKAGQITFLTGYGYFPSLSVADVIVAKQLGYYDAMCLNVRIVPSLPGQSALLLSANKVQFSSSDMGAVTANVGQGAKEKIVENEGNVPIDNLIVKADSSIKTLKDFKGKTIGIGGSYLGAPVQAMLATAGLQKNIDYKVVNIGYDYLKLKCCVDAEAGYRSSNPQTLEAAGIPVRQFYPEDYGVPGSFAALAASSTFLSEHPTAAEDWLRATYKGTLWAIDRAHTAQVIKFSKDLTKGDFDVDHETTRWVTESGLMLKSTPKDQEFGRVDPTLFQKVEDNLKTAGVVKITPAVSDMYDDHFLDAVTDGRNLIWPGPIGKAAQ
jgi:NitT/TauT family transport system substrate-binding protein